MGMNLAESRISNQSLFEDREYDTWASREGPILQETSLFDRFLAQRARSSSILEVGCGNGRILFDLYRRGYRELTGVDLSEPLLRVARQRAAGLQEGSACTFLKRDAVALGFPSRSFDVVIALQQITSLIQKPEDRERALCSYRDAMKDNGLLIASFLCWRGRWYNPLVALISCPVKLFRGEREVLNYRYLPWLKMSGKPNLRYFKERQPYLYWFSRKELLGLMERCGFEIIEFTSSRSLALGVPQFHYGGMIYVVARKRSRG